MLKFLYGIYAAKFAEFAVLAGYLSNFAVQKVGALEHTEYWIPAEQLATFNEHVVGLIEVIQEFGGAPNAQ